MAGVCVSSSLHSIPNSMTTASQARLFTALALIASSYGFVAPVSVGAVRSLGAPPAGGQRTAILTSSKRQRMATGAASGLRMQENDGTDALDRFVACLPYALPLADSFEWGHYIFDSFPLAAIPFLPLFPVIKLLNIPFVSFGIFIVLFNFVSRNPQFSRLVRFNTLQVTPCRVAMLAQATRLHCAQTKPPALLRTRSPIACHGFIVPLSRVRARGLARETLCHRRAAHIDTAKSIGDVALCGFALLTCSVLSGCHDGRRSIWM